MDSSKPGLVPSRVAKRVPLRGTNRESSERQTIHRSPGIPVPVGHQRHRAVASVHTEIADGILFRNEVTEAHPLRMLQIETWIRSG